MLKLKCFANISFYRFVSTSPSNIVEHLNNRTLIRVSGPEVSNYLQGLITNDIEHLSSGPGSMYTMFLNTAGRVLYDTIIYRNSEENTYFVECDKSISETLQKHLKIHKVRRKIDVTSLADELKIYAVFSNDKINTTSDNSQLSGGSIAPCQELNKSQPTALFKSDQDINIFRDPRITHLGSRVIAKTDVNVFEKLSKVINLEENTSGVNYRWLRYSLGVGEGVEDLPVGDCFPLECNCDYLHGVSFHKGCYIGQELTARIHHTGVVRKRLMPIHFTKIPLKVPDKRIVQDKVNLGKLRGVEKDVGLGVLRVSNVLAIKEIKLGDGIGVVSRPNWWPVEAPKEKINISKLQ
ncbi:putative transferase CAF17 homolog, mitochondrial [Zophobas morio]|uniref:putative transferase CAF17 homolog, mitochondrial n=1 Tax=Zophobas morio TaxID=2755281 RepID=UPI0030830B62